MNTKILTISIAAYNAEKYIEKTLDSIIKSKYISNIEVFVIDDGGMDNTLKIAENYKSRFPTSIIPVHKENGGYGTTVNYSIKNASGKYFKLLDGDDWFDTKQLDLYVSQLLSTNVDVVVTPYYRGRDESDYNIVRPSGLMPTEQKIKDIKNISLIGMWAITYKTEILRECGLQLPPKLLYTDQIFCTIPFVCAKTIMYYDNPVYFYRLGRDGQSVSKESRIKHLKDAIDNCTYLCQIYENNKTIVNKQYLLKRISAYYCAAIRTITLLPVNKETQNMIIEYENQIKDISPDVFKESTKIQTMGKFIKCMRSTKYLFYWILKIIPGGMPNWY